MKERHELKKDIDVTPLETTYKDYIYCMMILRFVATRIGLCIARRGKSSITIHH